MRVSLHTDQALKVLEYVKGLELRSGGIRGWKGAPAYPEISGYLIPTLLDYGERELANRLADWLVEIQNDDGSFCDMDGEKRSFDTAAVMEGLRDYYFRVGGKENYLVAKKSLDWLVSQVREDGAVRIHPQTMETHLYTMRVSWLIESQIGAQYWMETEWPSTRAHYAAYALEGLWKMGEEDFVKEKLAERDWASDDLCANAQMAILYHQAGFDPSSLVESVDRRSGEIINSWTAKWILDMWKVVDGH